jgi:hypothetical protein
MKRRAPTPIDGFVYFARDENTRLIKIGFSCDPNRRLGHLRWSEQSEITLLATVPATQRLESSLHRMMKPMRHHGEWYSPSPFIDACLAIIAEPSVGGREPPHYRAFYPPIPGHWFLEAVTQPRILNLLVQSATGAPRPLLAYSPQSSLLPGWAAS